MAENQKPPSEAKTGDVLPPVEELDVPPEMTFLEYLSTDKGHEIAKSFIDLWKTLQNATLVSNAEERKEQVKRQHSSWKLGVILQTVLAAIVILSAVLLAWKGKMESTVAGFLGVALGYVLGRRTSQ